jgi:ABC-type microcin C transport system duplicated ATPase subunit YejF
VTAASRSHPEETDEPRAVASVRDLHVSFRGRTGVVAAIRGVDVEVNPGEILAVVGAASPVPSWSTGNRLSALRTMPLGHSAALMFGPCSKIR